MIAKPVTRRRYGGLDAFEVADDKPELTVVLLHGYGAPGSDLVPLAAEAPVRRPCRWLFPAAPHTHPADPSGMARAWFPIDEGKLVLAQETGRAVDFGPEDPAGLAEAREALAGFIREAGLDMTRVVLGGFSQGSMVAADLALSGRTAPAGLVILSGNLIAERRWRAAASARAGLPFFQTHGRADPILGFQGALRLEELLRDAGLQGNLAPFDGGHTIPLEALTSLAVFLDAVSLKGDR